MTESGIDHRMDGSDAGAGEHRNRTFDGQRHVDHYAIPFNHAERLQAIREAADQAIELVVGDDALAAVFAQPDEGSAVATVRVGVPVERVDRDVRLRAHEPLVVDTIPLENFCPGLGPLEVESIVSPEVFGVLEGTLALAREILLQAVRGYRLGRRVLFIDGQQVGDAVVIQVFHGAHGEDLRT